MIDIGGKGGWNTTSNERSKENEKSKAEKNEEILDDFNRMLKGLEFLKPHGKEPSVTNFFTEKAPIYNANNMSSSRFNETTTYRPRVKLFDDLYPYRTSTTRPTINNKSNTMRPLMDSYPVTSTTTTTTNKWLDDYMKDVQKTLKSFEKPPHFYREPIHYNTHYNDYNTRSPVDRSDYHYESFTPTTSSSSPGLSPHKTKIIAGIVFAIVIVVIIPICRRLCRNNSNRGSVQYPQQHIHTDMTPPGQAGSVQYPREGVSAGAAQQHIQTDMTPPGQAEAVSPYIEMPLPYSDCNNKNVSEESPKHRNECVAMTTTPNAPGDVNTEFVSDNGRRVERLSVNETAHGTRRADDRANVMYVDEKSMSNQRAKYTK